MNDWLVNGGPLAVATAVRSTMLLCRLLLLLLLFSPVLSLLLLLLLLLQLPLLQAAAAAAVIPTARTDPCGASGNRGGGPFEPFT